DARKRAPLRHSRTISCTTSRPVRRDRERAADHRALAHASRRNTCARGAGTSGMSNPASQARPRRRRYVRELLTFAAFAVVLLSARASIADHYEVPSGSMLPSVEIGDHILVNKAAYGLRVPFSHSYVARFGG